MEKFWKVLDEKPKDLRETLLKNRNIEDQDSFFKPHLYKLTSPDKLFPDLEKAISRIKKAIKNKELIYIYGDFDVDGITGTAILWETINYLGGKVLPFIPHREKDGYGIHPEALEKLVKEGAGVIISVDCGITAVAEAKVAKEIGVDLIITDHHSFQDELPQPFALVHTDKLAGSGVAFMVAKALLEDFAKEEDSQYFKNLELASIGTIADMVPLTSDNRIIVSNGLQNLARSSRPGLKALYEESGISRKMGTFEVGFLISPRLNASGRMEHALDSLRLLLTRDKNRATTLASSLSKTNKERQQATASNLEHAKSYVESDGNGKLLFVHHESYLPGVIGLVAGRLVDAFYKPTIVISDTKPISKGSARSIRDFNITDAIGTQKRFLQSHGGHPMAAGFSIKPENRERFREGMLNFAEKSLSKKDLTPTLKIDSGLDVSNINRETLDLIKEFEPFGIGNPEPTFLTENIEVLDSRTVGVDGKHLKLVLRGHNQSFFDAIFFSHEGEKPQKGARVDVVYNLLEDTWQGRKRIQLKVKDLRPSKS